jgi:hypothetical protein
VQGQKRAHHAQLVTLLPHCRYSIITGQPVTCVTMMGLQSRIIGFSFFIRKDRFAFVIFFSLIVLGYRIKMKEIFATTFE